MWSTPGASLAASPQPDGLWSYSFSAATVRRHNADIDAGGSTDASSYHLRAGARRAVDHRVYGIKLKYDATDWSFAGASGFGALDPWSNIRRLGINGSLIHRSRRGWSYGMRPFVHWDYESAPDSDALSYGATVATIFGIARHRHIGVGVRLTRNIDDTSSAVPVFVIDWRFNQHWSLGNPRSADFTEPAGLELRYRLDDWRAALVGVLQSREFRLDDRGVAPRGTGKSEGLASFLRVSRRWGTRFNWHAYVGAVFDGELKVRDADDNLVAATQYDTAPFVGVSLEGTF